MFLRIYFSSSDLIEYLGISNKITKQNNSETSEGKKERLIWPLYSVLSIGLAYFVDLRREQKGQF